MNPEPNDPTDMAVLLKGWDLHIMRHRAVLDAYHKASLDYIAASTEYLRALSQPDLEKRAQAAVATLAANNRMAAAAYALSHEAENHESVYAATRDEILGILSQRACLAQFYAALPSPALAAK